MFKIIPFTIFLTFFTAFSAFSQTLAWDKKADNVVKDSKKLIVLLIDPTELPNDKKFKKNTDLVSAYEKHVAEFNKMIEAPVRAHWRLTKQVEFMTVRDLIALRKKAGGKELDETLVLRFNLMEYHF